MKVVKYFAALLGMVLFAFALSQVHPDHNAPLTSDTRANIWVLSDTHFIAPSLHDERTAYTEIKKSAAGKDMDYQPVAVHALVQSALKARPTALIITGDVTFNGEKASAESLMRRLQPLVANGTKVLIIPGNHDIYDGWARAYKGKQQLMTEQISPNDWRQIFHTSYAQAAAQDPNSLSYRVNLNHQYQLLLLDSNIYTIEPSNRPPNTGGKLSPQTLSWVRQQLAIGAHAHRKSIVFMHHNLYNHNEAVNEGYVLDDSDALKKLLTKYHVPLLFSGHIHAQDISRDPTGQCPTIEVVSGAFSVSPASYGIVSFSPNKITYQKKATNLTPYLTSAQRKNPDLLHYRRYLKRLFLQDGEGLAYGDLMDNGVTNEHDLDAAARLMGILNWRFFTGDDHPNKAELKRLHADPGWAVLERSPMLRRYLKTIVQDHNLNDQHLVIKHP
ncbi:MULTISPECIES: metallophosphoesterase [Lacticaseibacillus]|uniref:metallophosphoesterase n=1 Tax=Lacticaseibacillus TaxID=2759736 RepID=UPI00063DC350|nr:MULTISPECIES: metallophosphoesterase [Lacticaseibacillus]KLI74929.1 phosphohydrolase [Lacticaseibacillus casei]